MTNGTPSHKGYCFNFTLYTAHWHLLKKDHRFDLGSSNPKIIVECKSYKWIEGNKVPSAKITTWDQAMFYFYLTLDDYRKVLFVLKDFNSQRNETLAEYYLRMNAHLIPPEVEIWEYDEKPVWLKK